jgi:chromosome segregation ATPase
MMVTFIEAELARVTAERDEARAQLATFEAMMKDCEAEGDKARTQLATLEARVEQVKAEIGERGCACPRYGGLSKCVRCSALAILGGDTE